MPESESKYKAMCEALEDRLSVMRLAVRGIKNCVDTWRGYEGDDSIAGRALKSISGACDAVLTLEDTPIELPAK